MQQNSRLAKKIFLQFVRQGLKICGNLPYDTFDLCHGPGEGLLHHGVLGHVTRTRVGPGEEPAPRCFSEAFAVANLPFFRGLIYLGTTKIEDDANRPFCLQQLQSNFTLNFTAFMKLLLL